MSSHIQQATTKHLRIDSIHGKLFASTLLVCLHKFSTCPTNSLNIWIWTLCIHKSCTTTSSNILPGNCYSLISILPFSCSMVRKNNPFLQLTAHISAKVPASIVDRFWGQKRDTTWNILAACDFKLNFTYVLFGWKNRRMIHIFCLTTFLILNTNSFPPLGNCPFLCMNYLVLN